VRDSQARKKRRIKCRKTALLREHAGIEIRKRVCRWFSQGQITAQRLQKPLEATKRRDINFPRPRQLD